MAEHGFYKFHRGQMPPLLQLWMPMEGSKRAINKKKVIEKDKSG